MKVWIDVEFNIGDIVYLKTDSEQKERIVTAIEIRQGGLLIYQLSQGTHVGYHFPIEISTTMDILKKTSDVD